MEPITRETFNRWAAENKWLRLNDRATPNGRQYMYLTPSGKLVVAMCDLKGNLANIGEVVPSQLPP